MVHSEPDGPAGLQTQKESSDARRSSASKFCWFLRSLVVSATAGLLKALPLKSEEFAFQKQQRGKTENAALPACFLPGS